MIRTDRSAWMAVLLAFVVAASLTHCGNVGSAETSVGGGSGKSGDGNATTKATLPEGIPSDPNRAGCATCASIAPSPYLSPYQNPVIDAEFADPSVLTDANRYHVYGTGLGATNIQAADSNDLVHWSAPYDALPVLPTWAQAGATWAPDARIIGSSRVLYFTAQVRNTATPCIGVATRSAAAKTFTAVSSTPLVCQTDLGGSLDPSSFLDTDGTLYLIWRSWNTNSTDPRVFIQALSTDGMTLVGTPTPLFAASVAWEGQALYAPFLWRHDGLYVMFYGTAGTVGYAAAHAPLGPYTKNPEPLFAGQAGAGPVINPGGPSVTTALDGSEWLFFHSDNSAALNYRSLSMSQLAWSDSGPVVQPTYFVPEAGPTSTAPTVVSATYSNPVIDLDFPDPAIMRVGSTYYAFATNARGINVQVSQSSDMVHWSTPAEALPALPSWAAAPANLTWAPDVHAVGSQYVMFFVTRGQSQATQCIGVATSGAPQGPYISAAAQPLICQTTMGGSIDASGFVDSDGTQYVVWKNDGNSVGQDTWIWLQNLDATATVLQGSPTQLFKQTLSFEDTLVQAPFLQRKNNVYYLFYSGNSYVTDRYFINYASSAAIGGPYTKSPVPLGASSNSHGLVIGPGGLSLVDSPDGKSWAVYHQWNNESIQYRSMSISPVDYINGMPILTVTSGMALDGPRTNALP